MTPQLWYILITAVAAFLSAAGAWLRAHAAAKGTQANAAKIDAVHETVRKLNGGSSEPPA